MACNDCFQLDQIPGCSDSIVLGKVTINTAVYIYVKNIFSGYIHREEVTSDSQGSISLDLSEPDPSFYNQDSEYEVWVTLTTDNDRLTITVSDTTTHDCLNLSFYGVNSTNP